MSLKTCATLKMPLISKAGNILEPLNKLAKMLGQPNQHRKRTRIGAVAVEMAVTLTVFLLVLPGILEFGRAMMVQQLFVNGARIVARKAILGDSTNAEIAQFVGTTCLAAINAAPTVTLSVNGADIFAADRGDLCKVKVSIPFSNVSLLPAPAWLSSKVLQGTCIMEHE